MIEDLMAGSRLRWYVTTGVIAAGLLAILALVFLLEGPPVELLKWANLRGPLLPVSIVLYVLIIYPLMARFRARAIESLGPLVAADPGFGRAIADGFSSPRRRWELTSILVGVAVWTALSQPWRWALTPLGVYAAGADVLMFGLLGFLVFEGMDGTIRLSRMTRQHVRLDVFALSRLKPVAHWSLAISMAFVGGISISIAFQNLDTLRQWQTAAFYVLLVSVALIIFFLSMWSTHVAIVRAKQSELAVAASNAESSFRQLRLTSGQQSAPQNEPVYAAVTAWAAYERKLKEVPEWPYSANIARRLAASVLLPGVVYLLKLLLGWRV